MNLITIERIIIIIILNLETKTVGASSMVCKLNVLSRERRSWVQFPDLGSWKTDESYHTKNRRPIIASWFPVVV